MSDSALHALAGSAGGCVSMALTYPLVNLSTRTAVQTKRDDLPVHQALAKVLKEEGISGLYDGLSSSLLGIAATNGVYYACYEEMRSTLLRGKTRGSSAAALSTGEGILAGLVAGSITTLVTNPIWTVQTAQSTRRVTSAQSDPKSNDSTIKAARSIYARDGIKGFWRGIGPALVLVINPVIQYTSYERLLATLLAFRAARTKNETPAKIATRSSLSDWDMFVLGAASKLIATGSTYPIIVIKSRLQAATHKYESLLKGILVVLRNEGLRGLYAGMLPKLLQSVLTAAFMFMAQRRIYEALKKSLKTVPAAIDVLHH